MKGKTNIIPAGRLNGSDNIFQDRDVLEELGEHAIPVEPPVTVNCC